MLFRSGETEVRSPSIIKLGENNRQLTLQKSVREIEIPVCCSTKRFSNAGHLHGCEVSDVLAIRGTRRYFLTYLASAQGDPGSNPGVSTTDLLIGRTTPLVPASSVMRFLIRQQRPKASPIRSVIALVVLARS